MQWHLLGWINRGMMEKARQDLETNIRWKNFRIIPYINYAFCLIVYESALLSSKTMVNSPEYCICTSVMNTYCVKKRGFQFLSFFIFFYPSLYLFFPSQSPTTLSIAPQLSCILSCVFAIKLSLIKSLVNVSGHVLRISGRTSWLTVGGISQELSIFG